MLGSYLKIAIRSLLRNRIYSLINIAGLAMGVACCQLLSLYIWDEMSYDKHHQRGEDVYRIITDFQSDLIVNRTGTASPPIAMTFKDEIPEVEAAVRVLSPPGIKNYFTTGEKEKTQSLIRFNDNLFYESDGLLADSTLFEVLTYDFIEGNPEKALINSNSVVLSETLARKLFGGKHALDQMVSMSLGGGKLEEYKVTGVFREEHNTHIKANFFASMTTAGSWQSLFRENEWGGQNFVPSYLKLVPGHDKRAVERKMNEVLQRHGAAAMKAEGIHKTLSLEPVADIYLRSDVGQSPRITYLYVVGSIALVVLFIACINFMNLSTAKAARRATEIGIRKVMGAVRSSLIRQIFGEVMVIVVLAITISFVLLQLALPLFNELTNKTISFNSQNILFALLSTGAISIITSLLAGSYPAFYLTSFQPAQVLKGKLKQGSASSRLRQGLVVFQFIIAIVLICGVFIISRQLNFAMTKNLGFDADAKIALPLRTEEAHKQYEALKKEIARDGGVKDVSGSSYIPGTPIFRDANFYPDGGSMNKTIDINRNVVDVGYLELFNMQLIAGRSFTDNRETDSDHKFILNRTAVNLLGSTPEKIIGQGLHFDWLGKRYDFEVIGVMEDFHQNSLHEAIKPTSFEMEKNINRYDYVIASLSSSNIDQAIKNIEHTWRSLVLDTPFEYTFLDQTIQKQYDEDRRVSKIISSFGIVAMVICAMGLYGLSSYMAERRFKEIGIRKVLGASVQQIVAMMSTEFLKLIL
ncbi:MAG TPA: ABC transporter permease, partial [Cyclobacteriaceae bacterium]|nr:ABC transporter permease [Cyclobacteriaceae bacterium]